MTTKPIAVEPVASSQIHSIGHDPQTNTLAVRFKNSRGEPASLYHYRNFTKDDFSAFQAAESIGSHFYKHIKPHVDKHPYEKIVEDAAA